MENRILISGHRNVAGFQPVFATIKIANCEQRKEKQKPFELKREIDILLFLKLKTTIKK